MDEAQTKELVRDLREQLPGIEPERHVTDWGRSERVEGVLDRTLYDFLYQYWFRVAVEGIGNVPGDGAAVIVANHTGAASAAMIAKAVRHEHPHHRPVHFLIPPSLADRPAVGMLVTKAGAVPDHPANVRRLLFDEGQLVLVFPEPAKPLAHRYRVRRFAEHAAIATAIEAGAAIVPLAALGGEEATPVIARLPKVPGLPGLPRLRVAAPLPLPARFKLRFLEPIDPAGHDGAVLARDVQALIQENLLEMVAQRRSVWLG